MILDNMGVLAEWSRFYVPILVYCSPISLLISSEKEKEEIYTLGRNIKQEQKKEELLFHVDCPPQNSCASCSFCCHWSHTVYAECHIPPDQQTPVCFLLCLIFLVLAVANTPIAVSMQNDGIVHLQLCLPVQPLLSCLILWNDFLCRIFHRYFD